MVRLGQLWTSTLCLLTISGLLTAGAVTLPKGFNVKMLSSSQRAFLIPIEITNHKFAAALLNPESKEFKDLYKDVRTLFNSIYNCSGSICPTSSFYGGVAAMGFGPGESVIANTVVIFNTTSINQVVVWALFQRNGQKAAGNLQLNMAFSNRDNIMELGH